MKDCRGLSLVEILIVLALAGLLTTIVLQNFAQPKVTTVEEMRRSFSLERCADSLTVVGDWVQPVVSIGLKQVPLRSTRGDLCTAWAPIDMPLVDGQKVAAIQASYAGTPAFGVHALFVVTQ